MSLHSYHYARKLLVKDPPFSALIMCAIAKADAENLDKLMKAFPEIFEEYKMRHNAPLGILDSDGITDRIAVRNNILELQI